MPATPPTITSFSPGEGSTLTGWRVLKATATDNVGIAMMRINFGGLQYDDEFPPYEMPINTAERPDGPTTVQFTAFDPKGNQTTRLVNVRISNLLPQCKVNYDANPVVDLLDIFAYLDFWFEHSLRADFNLDYGIDILDIFAFLQAWFQYQGRTC